MSSLDELLQQSDFVSVHTPLNQSTRQMVNVEFLAKMKPNAVFINTCLLYTSDAADERSSVDLGGRRIIKKKNDIHISVRHINDKKKDDQSQRS